MRPVHDCIVIGAGPAGSTAARILAKQGFSVLVLEKEPWPRYKACGGGLTARAQKLIDFSLSDIVEDSISTVLVTWKKKDEVTLKFDTPLVSMVNRARFDDRLMQEARKAGAEFLPETEVQSFAPSERGVKLTTNRGEWEAAIVIAADGVESRFARVFNSQGMQRGIAVENEIAVSPDRAAAERGRMRLNFGDIAHGYGWVFPKRNHLSVGIGSFLPKIEDLTAKNRHWLEQLGLDQEPVSKRQGYRIPLGGQKLTIAQGPILLAGDAAGLADPLSGEGIFYALRSGTLAAEAVVQAKNQGSRQPSTVYTAKVEQELLPELHIARKLAHLFYSFSHFFYRMLQKDPTVAQSTLSPFLGQGTYGAILTEFEKHVAKGLVFGR